MRTIIVGAGGVGRHLATTLSHDADVVLIDRDQATLLAIEGELDVLPLVGDGIHREVLRRAQIDRAELLVAVTGSDAVNLATAALAVRLGVGRAIARVDDPDFYDVPTGIERGLLGVDFVCASRLVCNELLRRVSETHAGFVLAVAGSAHEIAGFRLGSDSPWLDKNPNKLKLRTPCRVVAIGRGATIRAVSELSRLEPGDVMILVGAANDVPAALRELDPNEAGRTVIVGGGEVGAQVAEILHETEREVRVIDHDRQRCEHLAATVLEAAVIHGDGTHLSLLKDERVGDASTFIATTKSDEVNLMSSLLSQQMGVRDTFALVQRPGYATVYEHLGIRGTTSVHEVFARAVRWLMPTRTLVVREHITGTDAEVVEMQIPRQLRRKLALRDIALPPRTIVVLLLDSRDGVTPLPLDGVLRGGEYIVAIVRDADVSDLEKAVLRLGGAASG